MADPTFTVAMPAYNAESTVSASIRSVLSQTRGDFELIVVDDGSTDSTTDVVSRFDDPRVRLLEQENQGPGEARNLAIAHGRGRYVSMLDSDDLWLPSYLEAMGAALDADSGAGMAYTDAWILDHTTGRIRKKSAMHYQDPPVPPPSDPQEFLRLLLIRGNFVFTSTTVRRVVLDAVGPFNMLLTPSEDYELWLRIVSNGYRAIRVEPKLAVYRKRGGSLSTNETAILFGEREALRRVADEYDVQDDVRDLARRRIRRIDRRIAGLSGDEPLSAVVERLRSIAVRAKIAIVDPFAWHDPPPPEVQTLLAAANANGEDAGADRRPRVGDDGPQAQDARIDA